MKLLSMAHARQAESRAEQISCCQISLPGEQHPARDNRNHPDRYTPGHVLAENDPGEPGSKDTFQIEEE